MYDLLKKRIEDARQKDGRSANAVSKAAGVNRSYIGKIGVLKGKRVPEPSALTIKNIARELKVPAAWLIDAIDPDEAEIARGTVWPPVDHAGAVPTPKPGQFIEDRDELALIAFWRPLERDQKEFMLNLLRNGALGVRKK